MANVDLNAAIRNLVSEEVERTLEPYRTLLDRMAGLFGKQPERAGRASRLAGRLGARAERAPRSGGGDASRFREGQTVRYKQGRGIFDAVVEAVDIERNLLTLARTKDNKKVERPADKVYGA